MTRFIPQYLIDLAANVLLFAFTRLCLQVSHLLMVALATGEVRMYKEGAVVHTFTLDKPVTALRYVCMHNCVSVYRNYYRHS